MNIYLSAAGIANASQVSGWLEWAAWVLDFRTAMDASYAGTTTATTALSGSILVRMATTSEWSTQGYTSTGPNACTLTDDTNDSALVLFNPHIPPIHPAYEDLLLHEISHATGWLSIMTGQHSSDSDDLLYPSVREHSFPLTTADMGGFSIVFGQRYPSVDTPDKTSAIRSPNGDVWIPDINGKQVHLDYIEGSPANAPRFLIASNVVNEESTGAYHTANGSVTIPAHSMGSDYMTTLTVVGSEVHVTYAYLI